MEEFEDNFRRCLQKFSAHLKAESTSPIMTRAAREVRLSSRRSANLIRSALELAAGEMEHTGEEMVITSDSVAGSNLQPGPQDSNEYAGNDTDEDIEDDVAGDSYHEGPSVQEDLENIEAVLGSSKAFQLLRENLRLFVHPDPIRRALFRVWPIALERSSPFEIKYEVEWDVSKLRKFYFSDGRKLGGILTLTGNALEAQAQQCREFVSSSWPGIGEFVLKGLQILLDTSTEVVTVTHDQATLVFKLGRDSEKEHPYMHTSVTVMAEHAVHEKVAAALTWIITAVRHSEYSQIAFSTAKIEAVNKKLPKIAIALVPLEVVPSGDFCWHPLFSHCVIAKGFPIKPRKQGRGVEISVADMLYLARCSSFVEYDGGLIAQGLRSFLIPTEELRNDNAVQWHFEPKFSSLGEAKVPKRISKILDQGHGIKHLKELDPHRLVQRRAFLGWAEEVSVTIGTSQYDGSKLRCSDLPDGPLVRNVKSYNISVGTSGHGIFGLTVTKQWTPISMPFRLPPSSVEMDVDETLQDESYANILIYDSEAKTSFLLPHPSAILFMAHRIVARRKYELFEGAKCTQLKFARPSADGATEALAVLEGSLELNLKKKCGRKEAKVNCFSRILTQILQKLGEAETGLQSAEAEFKRVEEAAPEFVHGVEFIDVINMKKSPRIQQAKVDQPWTFLAPDVGLVFFCTGLGQPIAPAFPHTLCDPWKSVPWGFDFMVATGISVRSLLGEGDRNGSSRLHAHVEWVRGRDLIQSHCVGQNTSVHHVQSLRKIENAPLMEGICKDLETYENAGFVFACRKKIRKPCPEILRNIEEIYSSRPSEISQYQPEGVPAALDSERDISVETAGSSNDDPIESVSDVNSQEVSGKPVVQSLVFGDHRGGKLLRQCNLDDSNPVKYNMDRSPQDKGFQHEPSVDCPRRTLARKGRLSETQIMSLKQSSELRLWQEKVGEPDVEIKRWEEPEEFIVHTYHGKGKGSEMQEIDLVGTIFNNLFK